MPGHTKEVLVASFSTSGRFLGKYKDEFVVVSGLGRMIDVAEGTYGYNKAIYIEEVFALFP